MVQGMLVGLGLFYKRSLATRFWHNFELDELQTHDFKYVKS